MNILRAAMVGDVVGESGLKALEQKLPPLIKNCGIDFAVVNGENAADGFGMTDAALKRMLGCGADVVTSGNHVWEKRDFWQTLDESDNVLRPANYSRDSPGRGWMCVEKAGASWVVVNVQGREFMTPIACPFRSFDKIIAALNTTASAHHNMYDQNGGSSVPGMFPIILVDFHAESSREKEALGYYLDGRAALVAGTHTHVQTADERLLPKGTAYITDLGMTGVAGSVIGMDVKICLDRARKQVLYRMEPASESSGSAEMQGVVAEIDADTGKAVSVRRI